MQRRLFTADVFTDRIFGGNPLAVVPDGTGIDAATMQRVAREMNLSETVFVLPPDSPAHTRKLRIFTPTAEIPFAGHPTLGTAFVLATIGENLNWIGRSLYLSWWCCFLPIVVLKTGYSNRCHAF